MAKTHWKIMFAMATGAALTLVVVQAQRRTPTLTGQDYAEIMQLANKYPYILPTCDGNGYAYADQFSDDGVFIDLWSNNGVKEGGIRWQGRDKLAEVAGAGPLKCTEGTISRKPEA
jgi:hypothetical protein